LCSDSEVVFFAESWGGLTPASVSDIDHNHVVEQVVALGQLRRFPDSPSAISQGSHIL